MRGNLGKAGFQEACFVVDWDVLPAVESMWKMVRMLLNTGMSGKGR